MHLRLFELARDYFKAKQDELGYEIVGGIVSPVSDEYKKKGLAPAADRVQMCQLAVKGSDWIVVDDWETLQSDWCRTRVVLRHFEDVLNMPSEKSTSRCVRVMLLGGGDLVQSFATPNLWSDEDVWLL